MADYRIIRPACDESVSERKQSNAQTNIVVQLALAAASQSTSSQKPQQTQSRLPAKRAESGR